MKLEGWVILVDWVHPDRPGIITPMAGWSPLYSSLSRAEVANRTHGGRVVAATLEIESE